MNPDVLDRFTTRYIALYNYLRLEGCRASTASTASTQARAMALAEQAWDAGNPSPRLCP